MRCVIERFLQGALLLAENLRPHLLLIPHFGKPCEARLREKKLVLSASSVSVG